MNCEISELKEYPLLTSLDIKYYAPYGGYISELKEYPLLTSLILYDCNEMSELEEYPLLTSLDIKKCNISKFEEYPHLTSLIVSVSLRPFNITSYDSRSETEQDCDNAMICINTSNKQKIQLYIKMMRLFSEIGKLYG